MTPRSVIGVKFKENVKFHITFDHLSSWTLDLRTSIKVNQHDEHLCHMLFHSNDIIRTNTRTHRTDCSTWATNVVGEERKMVINERTSSVRLSNSVHILRTIYLYFRISGMKMNQKCGPMPNVMVALPNIGGALCSTPQSLADAHY